jgi:SsrA-binding protein
MAAEPTSDGYKLVSDNRQARFQYEILETFEAGLVLQGTEVKAIRAGKVNLRDGFAQLRDDEVWLYNVHISPHQSASQFFNHEPLRIRKLLLHRLEINKLIGKVEQKGLTIVPLKMYLKKGKVKITIGVGRGKKLHDKRDDLKKKDANREIARVMKQQG